MVKRPKSPEAVEDDKYFTVYKPYPLNANWEVAEDYIACARWIANIIGPDPLHALYYKPSARSMILLEVEKKYPHNERLLGEHRWSLFLKKPTNEEAGKLSQIFHSLYSNGRDAQKDGWKRIHVEAAWFKEWSPVNALIRDPYPETYWCPTPPEDKTNKPLCRPLPVKDKAPPERPSRPVVGSSGWVSSKAAPPQNKPHVLKDAWERGKKVGLDTAGSAWNKPLMQNNQSAHGPSPTTVTSRAGNMSTTQQLVSPTGPSPTYPPGLKYQNNTAPHGLIKDPSASSSNLGSDPSSATNSGSGYGSDWSLTDQPFEELFEDKLIISLSPSQDRALYGIEDEDTSPEVNEVTNLNPWERGYTPGGLDDPNFDLWDDGGEAPAATATEKITNLWGDNDSTKVKKPAVAQCPYHRHECRKGVCQWRAKQVKEEEKLKALAEKGSWSRGTGRPRGSNTVSRGGRNNTQAGGNDKDSQDDGFSKVSRGGRSNRNHGRRKTQDSRGGYEDDGGSVQNGTGNGRGWDNVSEGPWD